MGTLDKVLNGILIGSIVAIGSISAYYKIKKDNEKWTKPPPQFTSDWTGNWQNGQWVGTWAPNTFTFSTGEERHGKKHDKSAKDKRAPRD